MSEKKKMRSEASSSNSNSSAGGNNRGDSLVVDVGRRRSSCGYCKSDGPTSISHAPMYGFKSAAEKTWRLSWGKGKSAVHAFNNFDPVRQLELGQK
ncbi:hypothetical protein HAX54_018770 [Datura stramonium]|uniref:Uncharacterized protein n=1 Tax=Datura stramonium TaxID=4076 RepID=A0ABS8UN61_DATST|nr:hypothetical protein [Datura stramonium]